MIRIAVLESLSPTAITVMSASTMQGFDDLSSKTSLKFHSKHVFSCRNNILSGITFSQWWRILLIYHPYIELKYLFRVLFITVLSIFNSIVASFESYYFPEALIKKIPLPDDPIIIIGHPRTGTTLIHNFLASDHRNFFHCDNMAAGFPSTFLVMEKFKYLLSGLIDKTRPMDSMPLTLDHPGEDEIATNLLSAGHSYYLPLMFMQQEVQLRKFLDFNSDLGACDDDFKSWLDAFSFLFRKVVFREMRTGHLSRRLVIKSPVHTARVPILRKLFPKAKFIYVHRHPEVVFKSAAHMADTMYWFCYLNTPSDELVTEFILWQFEYLWKSYNEAVQMSHNGARKVTDDTIEVSYEDLIRRPADTLKSIYEHVNIPYNEIHFKREINALSAYRVNNLADLPTSVKNAVRERWKSYYDAFGYF